MNSLFNYYVISFDKKMQQNMVQSFLTLQGCRQNNLKNFSLQIPKNTLIVITGVSGSGKSSLAFDTIFAEGQRRYLEYLSPRARAWIKQWPKPAVDLIEGLSPTLATGQGKTTLSSRGTVATYTDLYDFLALLYAKIGEQHSPVTRKKLTRYSRQEIIDLILKEYPVKTRLQLLSPVNLKKEETKAALHRLQQMGFIRLKINGEEWTSEETLPSLASIYQMDVVVDRLEMKEDIRARLSHSIDTAMDLSQGILKVQEGAQGPIHYFTEVYVCPETSLSFAPLEAADFNFNSPHGACPFCSGQGGWERVNPDLILWDPHRSLSEQVHEILEAFPKKMAGHLHQIWNTFLEKNHLNEELTTKNLPTDFLEKVLKGSSQELSISLSIKGEVKTLKTLWKGLMALIDPSLQNKLTRGHLSALPFVQWRVCSVCHGGRLKPESLACLIHNQSIHELNTLTVSALLQQIETWHFEGKEAKIVQEILPHLLSRLQFLEQVGLGYLELNRQGKTLSDGEVQRIQLASQIGAKLSGLIYILDEPSLGLHRQDIQQLYQVIQELKNLGNTVILVEHDKSLIKQAEHVIELGPGAGIHGGHLIFQGDVTSLLQDPSSLTGQWLSGRLMLPPPPKRKPKKHKLSIRQANLHNLKDFSVDIPLNCLVGFCGVSGSGKSTLVQEIIGIEFQKKLNQEPFSNALKGGSEIKRLVISQKQNEAFSSRSIPATYIGLMTPLRQLFAETRLAKARGYGPSRFSLNKKGGRCEACQGQGQIRVSMQLMPDLFLPCEVCQGLRYNYETLQVTWENLNIAQVLALPAEEAYTFFQFIPTLAPKLELMKDLGLDYLTLGQPFNTLSSGEIQRLRLIADLATQSLETTLYILDEPSAGLHLQDIEKLVKILHRLVEQGHSIFMVEHHLDLLHQADWLIELGPGGGPQGGQLIFEGPPEKISQANTPTGKIF